MLKALQETGAGGGMGELTPPGGLANVPRGSFSFASTGPGEPRRSPVDRSGSPSPGHSSQGRRMLPEEKQVLRQGALKRLAGGAVTSASGRGPGWADARVGTTSVSRRRGGPDVTNAASPGALSSSPSSVRFALEAGREGRAVAREYQPRKADVTMREGSAPAGDGRRAENSSGRGAGEQEEQLRARLFARRRRAR